MIPIVDLHCDLLLYLATKNARTPHSREARCSLPQLKEGGVIFQTLAIYTATKKGSHREALLQLEKYKALPKGEIKFAVAIENASGLLEEEEDFELIYERLDTFQREAGPLLYCSLTWNSENRFGGGNESKVGLKKEGRRLLEALAAKRIAIDLSHTSDALANDILEYIDARGLTLTPIASHSNFRKVTDVPRNLPDAIAKEIIRRKGVIGLNMVRKFVGDSFATNFVQMVEYGSKLGALNHLCFGADYFYEGDTPNLNLNGMAPLFVEEFGNASCYPKLLQLLEKKFKQEEIEGIAHKNAGSFLQRVHR